MSEWNGAVDYLSRINLTLMQANDAASRLDLYNWLHQLKIFYREISSIMKTEEINTLYEEGNQLSNQINKYLAIKHNPLYKNKPINTNLVQSLEQYEIKLRRIYKESGLQMRLQEDASKALR